MVKKFGLLERGGRSQHHDNIGSRSDLINPSDYGIGKNEVILI